MYIVKTVYNWHSREPANVPFIYRLNLYVLINRGKMRLPFVDSNLLYGGDSLRQV
jgi:hypothetical protein